MDTLRWNCSTNFIWVQKHLGYQISFQKMTSLFIILFRFILNSSSKNGSETTESKRVFMWDRDELRPVWVCIGLHTFLFILLHGTGLKMNWDRSDFVSVAGPDTSCVYKRKLAPARVSYRDGSLISNRVCTRMVCVVPCGSYTARHCKWWPIYHLLFHSDKKFLKGVVSGLFCLRSTPVSCLISSASTSQVYTATQMTHSCIWHSVLVCKGRTRAR